MSWKDTYKNRITTAEKAIKAIKDNDYVVFSQGASFPLLIGKLLAKCHQDYPHIHSVKTFDGGRYMKPDGDTPVDVVVLSVSNPDADGYCSFGSSCGYPQEVVKRATTVIAEMNEMTPYSFGPLNKIHVSDIDYIVPCAYFLPETPNPTFNELEKTIGMHCASLIQDGDCLNLGVGTLPEAVLLFLDDKYDLGLHTEVFTDRMADLMEKKVVNNTKKTLHKGKTVCAFVRGTRRAYNFVDNNLRVNLYPVDYVNDPRIIGQYDNLVSINTCKEVDIMGRATQETPFPKPYSGISIVVLPSTSADGKESRIVLSHGIDSMAPSYVDYVVTEYGVAKLKGMTFNECAQNLIAIAHPDFREGLTNELNKHKSNS